MNIPPQTLAAQSLAAHPGTSVWVSASAGTGKTHVLTARILRLLVTDPALRPHDLLALTFTRAAAAEMQNRVRHEVTHWATADDATLTRALTDLLGAPPTEAQRQRARALFGLVLDAPGGLNIGTIHSFCQRLLAAFPLEAGVPVHFTVLDDRAARALALDAQNTLFAQAAEGGLPDVPTWAFAAFAAALGEHGLREVFDTVLAGRRRYERLFDRGLAPVCADLCAHVGVPPDITPDDLHTAMYAAQRPGPRDEPLRAAARALLDHGGKTANEAGLALAEVLARPTASERAAAWDRYLKVFLTNEGEPRKKLVDKPTREAAPGVEETLLAEQALLHKAVLADRAARVAVHSVAYLSLAQALLRLYAQAKADRCALDFDDLVRATVRLLQTQGRAPWVRYKLDARLSHILLDEAQDSDPDQWDILRALIDDFYSGSGQHEGARTFFSVGDSKQSIYRFRGARKDVFEAMGSFLDQRGADGHTTARVALEASFRSSAPVLGVVDSLFSDPSHRAALDGGQGPLHHAVVHTQAGGHVELWPLAPKPDTDPTVADRWRTLPTRQPGAATAAVAVAERVAQTIADLLARGTVLTAERPPRPMTPGDVLILVQKRSAMPDLLAALDRAGLPHTGADEVNLADDPVAADLLAYLRVLVNPRDDLALAQVLRSPFFGWSDAELFALHAAREKKISLWDALYHQGGPAAGALRRLLEETLRLTPHDALVRGLDLTGARPRFLARFGASAADVMDGMLDLALAEGHRGVPTLIGFLHPFQHGDVPLKREAGGGGRIRVMTAHKSKGLQAPIVFLPDASHDPRTSKASKDPVRWAEDGTFDRFALYASKADTPAVAHLQTAETTRREADSLRLLYVALTRAKERLYIGGIGGGEADLSWHRWLTDHAAAHGWERTPDGGYVVRREVAVSAVAAPVPPPPPVAPPAWVTAPAPDETRAVPVKRAADSALGAAAGNVLHRLCELLPRVPAAEWPATAERLARRVGTLDDDTRTRVAAEAVRALTAFPWLLDAGARREVELALWVEGQPQVRRLDWMKVDGDTVTVVDFKFGRAPRTPPAGYVAQLEGYRQALQAVWPRATIKTALLWSSAEPPRLDWVTTGETP
jgi:ATP-dependent helicase/nuclease subunit A